MYCIYNVQDNTEICVEMSVNMLFMITYFIADTITNQKLIKRVHSYSYL